MKKKYIAYLRKINNILLNFGLDLSKVLSIRYTYKYLNGYYQFKKNGGDIGGIDPILFDYKEQAGSARGHYFHQDLIVASSIFLVNPLRHIDIGSRVDGFVSHVATFRKIEVMDIRDLTEVGHENISFIKADLMLKNSNLMEITDSISCLHAIEHFGLGRYGDPIDPLGHIKGFNNILNMLKVGGFLYISFPIGLKTVVHFNSQRIFDPKEIFEWVNDKNSIKLESFDYVDDAGRINKNFDLIKNNLILNFGCGIYKFRKLK